MQFPLLLLSISAYSFQNVFRRKYSKCVTGGDFTFNALMSLFATLYFIISAGELSFAWETVPYAILFAVCCGVTMVAILVSVREGSYALTNMIISYSLVIPTLFGPVFLGEKISYFAVAGIAVLLVSLYLVRAPKESTAAKPSAKWIIAIALAFVSNGMCSVSQKLQQIGQSSLYKNEFMIISMAILTVAFFALSVIRERRTVKGISVFSASLPAACGILNGVSNHMVLVLTGMMSTAIFFPVLSASSLVISFILSLVFYKEKLLARQMVAAGMSILAIILLNI